MEVEEVPLAQDRHHTRQAQDLRILRILLPDQVTHPAIQEALHHPLTEQPVAFTLIRARRTLLQGIMLTSLMAKLTSRSIPITRHRIITTRQAIIQLFS